MAIHRLRQGLRALFAFAQPVDLDLAAQYLTPDQLALFRRMHRGEQVHSLHVLRAILAQGSAPPELTTAALMHDLGKTRYPLMLWQKTIAVLVRRFARPTFDRLSSGDPRSRWSRPFVVYVQHPAWGADLLAQSGASEAAIWLVAHHQDAAEMGQTHELALLLERLQSADDTN